MYKYFRELEEKSNFRTYFNVSTADKSRNIRLTNVAFDKEVLEEVGNLASKIEKVDQMIMNLDENIFMNSADSSKYSFEEWQVIGEFFDRKRESYDIVRDNYYSLENNMWNTYYMLQEIKFYSVALLIIFPNYKTFFDELTQKIEEVLQKIRKKSSIILSPKENPGEVVWPDSWYITPNGYLYNTGLGHKQGNLIYPMFYDIYKTFLENKPITSSDYIKKIRDIQERGYITESELSYYSNVIYSLPTIQTKEIEEALEGEKWIVGLDEEEYERLKIQKHFKRPNVERSYQPNLITLIIGHLAAEMCLYNKFSALNTSDDKRESIEEILRLTKGDLDEILVKFCGFSKVSSVMPMTITTSSLSGVEDLKNYLDRGWTVEIVPGIVYDRCTKSVKESDFSSSMISKILDKSQEAYDGKGKVLVYRKI